MAKDSGFNGLSGSTGNTDSINLASSSNQVAATMTRRMSCKVYDAAVKGIVDVLQETEDLEDQLTPNKNTVLHIHIRGGMARTDCVLDIVRNWQNLLFLPNIKDETALHMAAKEGLTEIVKALVEQAKALHAGDTDLESGRKVTVKEMVEMRNKEGDTALHEAVRYNRLDVVKFLIGQDFEYCSNDVGETPLYMAVERGFDELVDEMLKTCNSAADYDGPNGRTALHRAIICSDAKGARARKILKKMPNPVATKRDENGWTPLHYAADFDEVSLAEELLKKDESAAYIADNAGRIPLHIAAGRNHIEIMKKLISHCPDCSEVVDKRRRNVLHLAVQTRSRKAVEHILKYSWGSNLINDKDVDGNTPLHLFASSLNFMPTLKTRHPTVDRMAVNKDGLTVADILMSSNSEAPLLKVFGQLFKIFKTTPAARRNVTVTLVGDDHGGKETEATKDGDDRDHDHSAKDKASEIKKASKTHLIVAALIATVTYAAGFTLPGGYKGEKGHQRGMAILAKKATFIAFYVTDCIAMFLSIVAVAIHFFMTLQEEQKQLSRCFKIASYSTLCSMIAMVAAFLMGACAVLLSNSLAVVALFFFLTTTFFLVYFILYPLLAKWVKIGRR